MVKSKLPPLSGSGLEAVESHPQKGAIKFFFKVKVFRHRNNLLNEGRKSNNLLQNCSKSDMLVLYVLMPSTIVYDPVFVPLRIFL